jgi:hypothetical protein
MTTPGFVTLGRDHDHRAATSIISTACRFTVSNSVTTGMHPQRPHPDKTNTVSGATSVSLQHHVNLMTRKGYEVFAAVPIGKKISPRQDIMAGGTKPVTIEDAPDAILFVANPSNVSTFRYF